jgi:hypothetical protein
LQRPTPENDLPDMSADERADERDRAPLSRRPMSALPTARGRHNPALASAAAR